MRTTLILMLIGLATGCSGGGPMSWEATAPSTAMDSNVFHDANKTAPSGTPSLPGVGGTGGPQEAEQPVPSKVTERKIIYTANINLIVDNFDGFEQKVADVVSQHGGYLASSNLDRMQGERRSGRWTARVPVDRYEEFLSAVRQLGVPSSQNQNAQDVTEEFVDLDARIANKRRLEARVLELLDRSEDEIQHVIEVERELARIREEIERMEGRLRFLKDQTAMTTVTISAREERDYVPPEAPILGSRLGMAWTNSLDRTTTFLQDGLVFFVGNAIALVVWLAGLCIAWLVLKSVWKRFRRSAASA